MPMVESTIQTETILDQLVAGKRAALSACMAEESLDAVRERALRQPEPLALGQALRDAHVRLIAEIKKASPAAGMLEDGLDPVARARSYASSGAAAISVLTEERRFLGSLDHLTAIRRDLESAGLAQRPPLLRKDFLFAPYHLYEARAAGADAVLLIVAILAQETLEALLALAKTLGLSALVEVHDESEVDRAVAAQAQIIGINNRDLRTFRTSLDVTERLRPRIPNGVIVVSESGIRDASDIERVAAADVDAVLVGEALMRSGDVAGSVRAFSSIRRPKAPRPDAAQ